VSRAVIELKDNKEYTLAVEGTQFREVMITPGNDDVLASVLLHVIRPISICYAVQRKIFLSVDTGCLFLHYVIDVIILS
jgi:hypothetical protein